MLPLEKLEQSNRTRFVEWIWKMDSDWCSPINKSSVFWKFIVLDLPFPFCFPLSWLQSTPSSLLLLPKYSHRGRWLPQGWPQPPLQPLDLRVQRAGCRFHMWERSIEVDPNLPGSACGDLTKSQLEETKFELVNFLKKKPAHARCSTSASWQVNLSEQPVQQPRWTMRRI